MSYVNACSVLHWQGKDFSNGILVALPTIIFKFGGIEPTQRGFFCDDTSIRYPYHPSTISTVVLVLVGLFTNGVVVSRRCDCFGFEQ